MFQRCAQRLARARIPQLRRFVLTPGEDAALVAAEFRTKNRGRASHRRLERLARACIPQPRRVVRTPGEDAAPVPAGLRAKNHAPDAPVPGL